LASKGFLCCFAVGDFKLLVAFEVFAPVLERLGWRTLVETGGQGWVVDSGGSESGYELDLIFYTSLWESGAGDLA
jgi:hypothetical protein